MPNRRVTPLLSDWSSGVVEAPRAVIEERLTAIGEQLAPFPVSPRLAKMLLTGRAQDVMAPVIAAVAALSALVRQLPVCAGGSSRESVWQPRSGRRRRRRPEPTT